MSSFVSGILSENWNLGLLGELKVKDQLPKSQIGRDYDVFWNNLTFEIKSSTQRHSVNTWLFSAPSSLETRGNRKIEEPDYYIFLGFDKSRTNILACWLVNTKNKGRKFKYSKFQSLSRVGKSKKFLIEFNHLVEYIKLTP